MSQAQHTSQHIAVVDDEQPARDMVGDYLRMHGFSVSLCDGGASLRQSFAQRVPDLIVLDLNMPEEDGLSIIRDLKQRNGVPIIMLTATASAIDRVVGLELGADDYLAKPCELRELLARIRSVLRRSTQGQQSQPTAPDAVNGTARRTPPGSAVRDEMAGSRCASLRDDSGNEHPLTASEYGLLKVFAANPKRVSRATACSSWPMPGTPRPSTGPSTCGSCAFDAEDRARSGPSLSDPDGTGEGVYLFPLPAKLLGWTEPLKDHTGRNNTPYSIPFFRPPQPRNNFGLRRNHFPCDVTRMQQRFANIPFQGLSFHKAR